MESVAIYCRLSKDDGDDVESNSIKTQKMILESYCKRQGWTVFDTYVDDGYSGMNFDRPGFQKLHQDVIDAKVNVVISKDLSRLGRNYILTGYYYQVFFPEVGVRYLAVNDHIDTKNENNDMAMAAFKNIMNDLHSKQLSKNILAARRTRIESKFNCNSIAPYGYKFNNEHVLIPDPEIIPIIKFIYEEYIKNPNVTRIASILNERHVPSRSAYLLHYATYQNGKVTTKWYRDAPYDVITNPAYMGAISVAARKRISPYKRKYIKIPVSEQEIIYDCHEAIVTRELWEQANALRQQVGFKTSGFKNPTRDFFAGRIYCAQCGKRMAMITKNNHVILTCRCWPPGKTNSYKSVNVVVVVRRLFSEIRKIALICETNEQHAYTFILEHLNLHRNISQVDMGIEINNAENRINVLNDKISNFDLYCKNLQQRQKDAVFAALESSLKEDKEFLERLKNSDRGILSGSDIDQFVRVARKYGYILSLERDVLDDLVEKIYVSQKMNDSYFQNDRVYVKYKHIGVLLGV